MTRRLVIFGLIVLAALLPLAAMPAAVLDIIGAPVVVARVVPFAGADAQPVALLALALFRAPPSR